MQQSGFSPKKFDHYKSDIHYFYMHCQHKKTTMSIPVRDAKIYVKELQQIVIGYETKGTTILFSIQEVIQGNVPFIRFELVTDKWFITPPDQPRALNKRRADIYIDLNRSGDLIRICETVYGNHPNTRVDDCPGLRPGFYPTGLEQGPKILPKGYNCFRAPIFNASFDISELNTRLRPIGAEFFIDYEENDETHLYRFDTPALHFALRAPIWLKEQETAVQNKWIIDIDIKCIKAILDCIKRIAAASLSS